MRWIDNFLNQITMYRLVLYYLIVLVGLGIILAAFHILPFSPLELLFSSLFLVVLCLSINKIIARLFRIPSNIESAYITALILALILTPGLSSHGIRFFIWVSLFAMTSKYILAINKKHIFNPTAIAVVVTGFTLL